MVTLVWRAKEESLHGGDDARERRALRARRPRTAHLDRRRGRGLRADAPGARGSRHPAALLPDRAARAATSARRSSARVHHRADAAEADEPRQRDPPQRRCRTPSRGSSTTTCTTEEDRRSMIDGVRLAARASAHAPRCAAASSRPRRTPTLLDFIRERTHTIFHPVGTCAMGAVVDARAARARRRGAARRRRLGDADGPARQHERADDHGRREGRRHDPRPPAAARGLSAALGRLSAMTDVLVCGDTLRSPEMRHEVPLMIPDPFLYVEVGADRHVVVSPLEARGSRRSIRARGPSVRGVRAGRDPRVGRRPVGRDARDDGAGVPGRGRRGRRRSGRLPVELADRLRAAGVAVAANRELFNARRRVKNASEPAGIRRAQAGGGGGDARGDGAAARRRTRTRTAASRSTGRHAQLRAAEGRDRPRRSRTPGCSADAVIVSHGAQTAIGHELGVGNDRGRRADRDRPLASRCRDRPASPT